MDDKFPALTAAVVAMLMAIPLAEHAFGFFLGASSRWEILYGGIWYYGITLVLAIAVLYWMIDEYSFPTWLLVSWLIPIALIGFDIFLHVSAINEWDLGLCAIGWCYTQVGIIYWGIGFVCSLPTIYMLGSGS